MLGFVAANDQPGPNSVSAWWPSAGLGVVSVYVVAKRWRLIVVSLLAASIVGIALSAGRPLLMALAIGTGIIVEALIVSRFTVHVDDKPRLTTMREVMRFVSGLLLGSLVAGLIVGSTFKYYVGASGTYADIVLNIVIPHAASIAVIAPVALIARMKTRSGTPLARILHPILLTIAALVSFAPGGFAQLTFLPVPLLAWAAFTFSMWFAVIELLLVSLLVVGVTAISDSSPFSWLQAMWLDPTSVVQLYILVLTVTTLMIAAARNERQKLEEEHMATAMMLHDGFEQSANGFALIQQDAASFRVLDVNSAALSLLGCCFDDEGEIIEDSRLTRLFSMQLAAREGAMTEVWDDADSPTPVSVTVSRNTNSTFGQILLVAVVDLRAVRAAEAALALQIEREKAVVEKLTALSQRQDDFVSSVTHELRTPITAVMGFAEELDETALDTEQREYVTIIQRNSARLLSVIEDVLTFSRREPGMSDGTCADVDLADSLAATLDDLRHGIRDKEIVVTNSLGDDPLLVRAISNDLSRVLINLATNAVKFTPIGGSIDFSYSTTGDRVALTMVDSGPGIAPDDLDKVFDRFYRSSRATHDGIQGTGLGLSIVQDLVTNMQGTIVLESDGQSGTTAVLTLPAVETSS